MRIKPDYELGSNPISFNFRETLAVPFLYHFWTPDLYYFLTPHNILNMSNPKTFLGVIIIFYNFLISLASLNHVETKADTFPVLLS